MVNKCVVGLDLSMTQTGMAMFSDDEIEIPETGVVVTRGKKDETWESRNSRLDYITDRIEEWITAKRRGILTGIFVEGPSYGSTTGHQHDRSGLWWRVYGRMNSIAPVYVIQPQTRAKYATGSGAANKDKVLAATVRQFLHVDVWSNDIADALQLAAMGAREQGWPVDGQKSKTALDAMGKIAR